MMNPAFRDFPAADVLHIRFADRATADCQDLSAMVTAEPDGDGQVISLEIAQASVWLQQLQEAMGQAPQTGQPTP